MSKKNNNILYILGGILILVIIILFAMNLNLNKRLSEPDFYEFPIRDDAQRIEYDLRETIELNISSEICLKELNGNRIVLPNSRKSFYVNNNLNCLIDNIILNKKTFENGYFTNLEEYDSIGYSAICKCWK